MFIQIIRGRVADRAAVQRLGERWNAELRPGAAGFLGATIGVTGDGSFVNLARFESREAAAANSSRPEQGAWWHELEQCFTEPPNFRDSDDVEVYEHGDLDTAGFVQVMEGRLHDVERARAFTAATMPMLAGERPDLIGDLQVFHADGTFTDVAYFRTEAEARAGESKEPSEQMRQAMQEMEGLYEVTEYLDLRDPLLF